MTIKGKAIEMKKQIVLVGAGGHCKVVVDTIMAAGEYEIVGIVSRAPGEKDVLEKKIIGNDSKLPEIFKAGCTKAFIAVGGLGNPGIRVKLDEHLKHIGFSLPVIKHPAAYVSGSARVGEGTFIAAGAVIQPGSVIGRNCIINTNSSVDHDCEVGDFAHISPGAALSGGIKIGARTHIGTGTSVIEAKTIGADAVIGAGSVVVTDIPAGSKAYGNPCRVVGENNG